MAKIEFDGLFPKRIGNIVLYRWENKVVIKAISGFTSEALKNDPQYVLSRQNASEFGRVSSLCKQFRMALVGILPTQNNLAVVNALTKKMREVLDYDTINNRGARQLADALATPEGRQLLEGYNFNPEDTNSLLYTLSKDFLHIDFEHFKFLKKEVNVMVRIHQLAFDFTTGTYVLVSDDWIAVPAEAMPISVELRLHETPASSGVFFTLLEAQYNQKFEKAQLSNEAFCEKSVLVVRVSC